MNTFTIYQQIQISDFRFYKYNLYLYKVFINTSEAIKMIVYSIYHNEIFCNKRLGYGLGNKNVLYECIMMKK